MLEYYPVRYAEKVLREIKRVIKTGGKCVIDIVNPANKEMQQRDYLYKYDIDAFETLFQKLGYDLQEKNKVKWMLQENSWIWRREQR